MFKIEESPNREHLDVENQSVKGLEIMLRTQLKALMIPYGEDGTFLPTPTRFLERRGSTQLFQNAQTPERKVKE